MLQNLFEQHEVAFILPVALLLFRLRLGVLLKP